MAHVERRDTNRWRARYREPSGKERSRTFARRSDAEKFLKAIEADKLRGVYHDPALGRETLDAYWERWKDSAKLRLRPSTMGLMEMHWRVHVEPRLGSRSLNAITRLDVQDVVNGILSTGGSIYTAENALRLLRRLLSSATDDGLLVRSPANGVRAPRRPQREIPYLRAEQVAQLVDVMPDRWRAFVLVAAYGGLRFGELTALRINRIDFLRRTVRVEEAIVEANGQLYAGPTKNGRARSVTLPSFVIEALSEHVRLWPPNAEGLVFTTDDGRPVRRSNWYKAVWWPATKAAGLKGTKFHALRHTSAALAIMAGAHPKTIQARLGHHSAAFTLDVYGALFDGLDAELADKLDAMNSSIKLEAPAAFLRPAGGLDV